MVTVFQRVARRIEAAKDPLLLIRIEMRPHEREDGKDEKSRPDEVPYGKTRSKEHESDYRYVYEDRSEVLCQREDTYDYPRVACELKNAQRVIDTALETVYVL